MVDRGCAPAGWLVMEEPRGASLPVDPMGRAPAEVLAGPPDNAAVARLGGDGGELLVSGVPGPVFVIEGVGSQTAVEDADESVGEGAEGLVVGGAAGSLPVVERAGPR